ncbi:hypothetical protein [Arenimonas sp.]|uniref:hypothetical protein n=1 Tax=Arenimonas sp. TaxID=1872635 RepID=UPI0039E6E3DB
MIVSINPCDSIEALAVRDRTMTRSEYTDARRRAHQLDTEAWLLRKEMPKAAAADEAYARRIRSAIAVPVDRTESARNVRWQRLTLALRTSARAVLLRNQARHIAREGAVA